MLNMTDQSLNKIYFNPGQPGAFAGPDKLNKVLLQKQGANKTIPKDVKSWVQNQDAYSLLRPLKRKFRRNRIIPAGRDDLWDMDLADVSNIAKYNNGIKFWLIVIDVFSRYLWLKPLTDKSHISVVNALNEILSEGRVPKKIRSDKGKEFLNRWANKFFRDKGIYHFTTQNETKANYAERVIRTMKNLVYRYIMHKQNYKYVDVLQSLVNNYNQRPHTSLLQNSPASIKDDNPTLWKKMYIDTAENQKFQPFKLKIGDYVRLSYLKHPFSRDYQEKWTEEVFVIRERFHKEGIALYKVKDWDGEEVKGTWYEPELQKVDKNKDDMWKIEKILKTRRRLGTKELYVKWFGWPDKFNSWIPQSDVQDI
jgi:hypothetical protein